MTTIVSVNGRKGGITKTTLSKNLAAACANAGLKTLLVDADGQGNASSGVRVKPHDAFHSLIVHDAEWADVLVPVPVEFHGEGELFLLSASNLQREVELFKESPVRIYERFGELDGFFDVIVVDTSPGITEVHAAFFYVADYVILPTLCEYDSIMSLNSTVAYLTAAMQKGSEQGYRSAEILGIQPNCFTAAEKVQRTNIGYLRGKYEQFHVFEAMRNLTVWRQAGQMRQSIFNYAPADDYNARRQARIAAHEFEPLVNAVISRVQTKVS